MELHLDHTQTELLRELLDSDWRDLRYEIADTDNSSFKRNLKQREQTLRSEALVRYAEQEGYDLLAVGTRGDPGPAASLATALAVSTPVPVLLASVPPGRPWRSRHRRDRRRPAVVASGPVEGDLRPLGRSVRSARMEA